jgi:hypothetical protein
MNKTILVGLAILTVFTSAASAWTNRTHERHAIKPHASAAAMNANASTRAMNANAFGGPVGGWRGGVNSNDHAAYMKNLHDSGYDPKNNFNSNGILKQQ